MLSNDARRSELIYNVCYPAAAVAGHCLAVDIGAVALSSKAHIQCTIIDRPHSPQPPCFLLLLPGFYCCHSLSSFAYTPCISLFSYHGDGGIDVLLYKVLGSAPQLLNIH